MIFRPATPGFLITLTATILLALVSFNVPLIKSIYFLKATLSISGVNGTMTIGTLGYCLELSTNGTTCSSPRVGYTFDPRALVGDLPLNVNIPNVVVKWITYALFLHVIALCAAGVSALFGLLAHVREMSMACCSTCVSGLAAVLALVAFVFDVVLFFVVKKRVQDIEGGENSAQFGGAVWMTLAAAVLLFFSGCVYACGRCMLSRRPRVRGSGGDDEYGKGSVLPTSHAEQMRLDAVRAEAERKARQKNEVGLPAFPEQADVVKPLRHMDDDASDGDEPYRDHKALGYGAGVGAPRRQGSASTMGTHAQQPSYRGGYAQAPPGTRAVDEYYSSSPSSPARSNAGAPGMSYPPNRQYSTSPGATAAVGAGAAGIGAGAGYLAATSGAAYGHRTSDTSYHTAASTPSQHQQYPSAYSTYNINNNNNEPNPYSSSGMPGVFATSSTTSPPPRQPSQPYADPYYPSSSHAAYASNAAPGASSTAYGGGDYAYGAQPYDPYNASGYPTAITSSTTAAATTGVVGYATSGGSAYQSPTATGVHQPERSYTLGGGGYGANLVPSSSSPSPAAAKGALNSAYGAPALSTSPPPMPTASVHGYNPIPNPNPNTNVSVGAGASSTTYPYPTPGGGGGGGGQGSQGSSYEDAPPGYEAEAQTGGAPGPSVHVPAWGSKSGFS
ncbi:hypothetical protein ACEPAG_170 [Sanghuangporus baumii]